MPGKILVAVAAAFLTATASASPIPDRERVRLLVDAGEWGDVIEILTPALERNPYRGEDWHILGVAHARLGDCETAAPLLNRGIELGVNSRTWGMQDAHVEAAQCAALLGDPGLAVDHLSIAQARYKFSDFERFNADPTYAELIEQPEYRRLAGLGDWANVDRVEGWTADLDYFVDLMERRHPDPFHTADEREWRNAVAELREQIPVLTDLAIRVRRRLADHRCRTGV